MKISVSLLFAPILMLTTACSSHYSASSYGHHRGHVSVSLHGGHHSSSGDVLAALIVGGVIGHLLTEEAHKDNVSSQTVKQSRDDELLNGYPLSSKATIQIEKNSEQNRFYQSGKDKNCYLMERNDEGAVVIVAMVPKFSCQ